MTNNTESIDKQPLPSEDASGPIRFGFTLLFVVFVLFGGWMAFAPLASSSVAAGQVSADLDKKTIQHLEGGIIDAIYVKDGDKVKKGDLLLKLKDVNIKAQLDILNTQYQDTLGIHTRLKYLSENKKRIEFPSELYDENVIKDQKELFYTTIKSLQEEKNINRKRVVQLQNQIEGLNSLKESKVRRLKSINEEIAEREELLKERLVDKSKVRDLKREANLVDGDIANTRSEIAKLKEQISEIENQQLLRDKEFQKETLSKLAESKTQLADVQSRIIATKDTLDRTSITSPINGTVVGFNMHTIGGVIAPGSNILELIPENSDLIVLAQVQITDIDKVKVGLISDVRFSAFNLQQTHVIEGEVIHVSADTFVDEQSGIPYYEAKVKVTNNGVKQLKEYGFNLVSGMPVEVMINIGERTVLSYFLKPFMDMFSRGFNEE
jgi:epimerase transport system membrane fusion protein